MPELNIEKKVLESILENIDLAVIITDTNRNIIEFSKGAQEMTGFGFTEAFEKPLDTILKVFNEEHPINVDEYCPIESFGIEGVVFKEKDVKVVDKTGNTKIVDLQVKKIKESETANIGCILILRDTSKEMELERMKLDFISMSAHVLRTPITILRGYSQILLRENVVSKLNETEIEAINQIATASDNLRDRVENMLAISNIKDGEIHINPIPLSIEGTIQSVVDKYKAHASDKNLNLTFIPPQQEVPRAYAEVGKVKDVLEKLVDNAIKFTDEGGVEIWIEVTDTFIKTFVKDTGIGIPDEGITQLFTKFYRVKRKALNMAQGNGLSLYTSKKLIEALGGDIGVQKTQEKGTTVYFTLPIFREDLKQVKTIV